MQQLIEAKRINENMHKNMAYISTFTQAQKKESLLMF